MVEHHKDDWNYGNAIHKANSALGMLALRNGDKAAARRHLLASAETKGSPQMNSFGPNMQFADAMLHAGGHEAVLVYFARCLALSRVVARFGKWEMSILIPGHRWSAMAGGLSLAPICFIDGDAADQAMTTTRCGRFRASN